MSEYLAQHLVDLANERLEVGAFREVSRDGMITRLWDKAEDMQASFILHSGATQCDD